MGRKDRRGGGLAEMGGGVESTLTANQIRGGGSIGIGA